MRLPRLTRLLALAIPASAVLVCVPAGADSNADLHGRKAGYPN